MLPEPVELEEEDVCDPEEVDEAVAEPVISVVETCEAATGQRQILDMTTHLDCSSCRLNL